MPSLRATINLSLCVLLSCVTADAAKPSVEREFHIVKRVETPKNGEPMFYLQPLLGVECSNNSLNRLSMLSENQANYPLPESGCGPTAMLNILIWYEKYGLITPYSREADSARYKYNLFQEIDRRLTNQAGMIRTEDSGVNNMHTAMVMDAFVQEQSEGTVRIHTDAIAAPIDLNQLLNTMQNFRSGYLIVAPKVRSTGQLLADHAAVVIRVDRAGYLTLATWGQLYRGLIKSRPDGQWFIPQDPDHMELKIRGLTCFIPFRPVTAASQ